MLTAVYILPHQVLRGFIFLTCFIRDIVLYAWHHFIPLPFLFIIYSCHVLHKLARGICLTHAHTHAYAHTQEHYVFLSHLYVVRPQFSIAPDEKSGIATTSNLGN
jgi:hypothetical protein